MHYITIDITQLMAHSVMTKMWHKLGMYLEHCLCFNAPHVRPCRLDQLLCVVQGRQSSAIPTVLRLQRNVSCCQKVALGNL